MIQVGHLDRKVTGLKDLFYEVQTAADQHATRLGGQTGPATTNDDNVNFSSSSFCLSPIIISAFLSILLSYFIRFSFFKDGVLVY